MKRTYAILLGLCFFAVQWATAQDVKMKSYVDALMKKMTTEEKIGQLNLVVTGYVPTGTTVSSDTEKKIIVGQVGGMFGAHDPVRMRGIQKIAVEKSRLKIPLFFGLDVIHGHRTVFPIPLGLAAVCVNAHVVPHTYKSLIKTFIYNAKLDVANETTLLFR